MHMNHPHPEVCALINLEKIVITLEAIKQDIYENAQWPSDKAFKLMEVHHF